MKQKAIKDGLLVLRVLLVGILVTMWAGVGVVSADTPNPVRSLPEAVAPGQEFEVTVTFTAPEDGFTIISLSDRAPDGWTVTVDTAWCMPAADLADTPQPNRADYLWGMFDTYDEGTAFTAVYRVQVPAGAAPGEYTFELEGFQYFIEVDGTVTGPFTADMGGANAVVVALYDLTINSTDGGQVTTPGEGIFAGYEPGEVVDLLAVADDHYQFVEWTGDIDEIDDPYAAETTITMRGDYEITAHFQEESSPTEYTLATNSTAGGHVAVPGEGEFVYEKDTVVDLEAVADEGYRFISWTGEIGDINDPHAATTFITMSGNYSITANFGAPTTRYVCGTQGDDTTGEGTMESPWATIQHAIDQSDPGDTIIVGPGTYDEFIDIHKPLTVMSSDGAEDTSIFPTTPPGGGTPGQVVLISSGGVVFGGAPASSDHGFTVKIDGYVDEEWLAPDTGIAVDAFGPRGLPNAVENVSILCNIIDVDSIDYGEGIFAGGGDTIIIRNNEVAVAIEDGEAHGISVNGFHTAKVLDNVVDVTATGGEARASGIGLDHIHRAQVTGNTVTANAEGESWAGATGIRLFDFGRADVNSNTVTVDSSTSGFMGDFADALGIYLDGYSADRANVLGNTVTVKADGTRAYSEGITVYNVWGEAKIADNTVSAMAEASGGGGDMDETALEYDSYASAEGHGIRTEWTGRTVIHGNTVDVTADAVTGEEEYVFAYCEANSFGIYARESYPARVTDNTVTSRADAGAEDSYAGGQAMAQAFGIVLDGSYPDYGFVPVIDGNSVEAVGSARATGMAGSGHDIYSESLPGRIQGNLLAAADKAFTAGPQEFSEAWALGLGIGIYAWNCPEIQITNNDPVIAAGTTTATVTASEEVPTVLPENWGAGMGQGVAIAIEDCPHAYVADNGRESGVHGTGTAEVTVTPADEILVEYTQAYGEAYGMGLGIYAWGGEPVTVSDNNVAARAEASTTVAAVEEVPGEDAFAYGYSFTHAAGIYVSAPHALISGNAVDAWADAVFGGTAESVSSEDPYAWGGAESTSMGIATDYGHQSQILDNSPVTASAHAYADISARGESFTLDAAGHGGSAAYGVGILSVGDYMPVISGNDAFGSGRAETGVFAESSVPLDWAGASGFAESVGFGLMVQGTHGAEVTWNAFAGDASVAVEVEADATFDDEWTLGYSTAADIHNAWSSNSHINYNDMGNGVTAMIEYEGLAVRKYGLYNDDSTGVNARYNWWGDPSGPGGRGAGIGAAIDWNYGDVPYEWWLSHPIADLLEDKAGYFGFGVEVMQGWNTLSTPVALEHPGFADIAALGHGLDWAIAYYYDPTQANPWQQVTPSFNLYPLEGIYLKMKADDVVFFNTNPATYAPQRNLTRGQSWYLIGSTPYDETFPFTTEMPVDMALVSLEQTPTGQRGYNQVVSPSIGGQAPWAWVPGMNPQPLVRGKGYWVFMENPDTLAGFIFTPLPVTMPVWPPNG